VRIETEGIINGKIFTVYSEMHLPLFKRNLFKNPFKDALGECKTFLLRNSLKQINWHYQKKGKKASFSLHGTFNTCWLPTAANI